ncbi:GTPase [Clostridioides sp. ES-S-0001-03]|uniref:GTPase n=1 Tax=Clostridioides sp. ES-S-0001-03 TaxID=2770771 RepID=UPI001D0C0729|nr:50S ribosome-binding GTPase [Clostridioides sp. ES-S-0001-03]
MSNELYNGIINLLENGRNELKRYNLKEKSILLFLGASGVGKSTCINYLKGCDMEEKTDAETGQVYITAKDSAVDIGNGVYSKTLCPEVVDIENKAFSLCDCPGFFDNRGAEYMIAGAMLVRETISASLKVKGIVVILDYQSLLDSRHTLLIDTAKNLKDMFNEYTQYKENFFFIINKIPKPLSGNVTKEKVRNILKKVKEDLDSQEKYYEGYKELVYLLNVVLADNVSIELCNPLDTKPENLLRELEKLPTTFKKTDMGLMLTASCKIEIQKAVDTTYKELEKLLAPYIESVKKALEDSISILSSIENLKEKKSQLEQMYQSLCKTNSIEELMEFVQGLFYGDGVQKVNILEKIRLVLELNSYCKETNIVGLSELLKSLLNTTLEDTLKCIKYWIAEKELEEEEAEKLLDAEYRREKIQNCTYIKSYEKDKVLSIYIPVPKVNLSDLTKIISGYKLNELSSIYMYGECELKIDCDMKKDVFSGKNIVLLVEKLCIPKGSYSINVSGNDAKKLDGESSIYNGMNGRAGNNAGTSGDILISFKHIQKEGELKLYADGGQGGNGQGGKVGETGASGIAGANAKLGSKPEKKEFNKEKGTKYYIVEAEKGKQGDTGGIGGDGGNAGLGSKAGQIYLLGQATVLKSFISQIDGRHGLAGKGGSGGKGGAGGIGGIRGIFEETIRYIGISVPIDDSDRNYYYFDRYVIGRGSDSEETADDGKALDDLYTKHKDWTIKKLADSGLDGAQGKEGNPGKSLVENELLKQEYSLSMDTFFYQFFERFGFSGSKGYRNLKLLCAVGILEADILEISHIYEIFNAVEKVEMQLNREILQKYYKFDKKNKEVISLDDMHIKKAFYQEAKEIYDYLINKLMQSNRIEAFVKENQSFSEWSMILFALEQKAAFYMQMIEEDEIGGNRVTDIRTLTDYLEKTLKELEQGKKDELKESYFNTYKESVLTQINSGNQQIEVLKKELENKMLSVGAKMNLLIQEILKIKEDEKEDIKKLEEKKEKLQEQMKIQLILSGIQSALSLLSSLSGIGQACLGAFDSAKSLKENLSAKEEEYQWTNRMVNFSDFKIDSEGMSFVLGTQLNEDRKNALGAMTNKLVGVDDGKRENFNKIKEIMTKSLDNNDYQGKENDIAVAKNGLDEGEYEKIYKSIQKKEMGMLEANYSNKQQKDKLVALEKCKASIERQQKTATIKNVLSIGSASCSFINTAISSVNNCLNVKASFEDKIKVVKDAIKSKEDNIKKLDNLNIQMEEFKNKTLKESIIPFVDGFDTTVKNQDIFENEISRLKMKDVLTELIKKFEILKMENSEDISGIFKKVQDMMDAQIIITDKIDKKKDNLAMGELIYQMSDSGNQMNEYQKKLIHQIELNQIRYLCQLEAAAFQLWTFPFGSNIVNILNRCHVGITENEDEVLKQAKEQNRQIKEFLVQDTYQWQKTDNHILKIPLAGSLAGKSRVGFENTFSLYDCNEEEVKKLLTGEEISFEIPLNQNYDAMKYVTIYANIPNLRRNILDDSLKINVHMHLYDKGYFSLYDDNKDMHYQYVFPQNYIDITHGLDVKYKKDDDSDSVNSIWSSIEDKGIEKFKNAGLNSGRSPYSMAKLSLKAHFNKKLSYDLLTSEQNKKLESYFEKSSKDAWNQSIESFKKLGYIDKRGILLKNWSEIKKDMDNNGEIMKYFSILQADLWEKIIYEQMSILKENIPNLTIEFIGCGIYVESEFNYLKQNELKCYEQRLIEI